MNSFVKKFIENTAYLIKTDMWAAFFYEWYRECAKVWPPQDEEEELFTILKQAGISVDWDARKLVIIEATKQNISKVLKYQDEWSGDNIPIRYLEDELTTHLGYDVYEIDTFVGKAASDLALRQTADNEGYKIPGR